MHLRPVTAEDHTAVLALAEAAGFGMTSLPADADVLAKKIDASLKSFARASERQGNEAFLFVLEDPEKQRIVGTTGIKAHVGLNQPFYSYKLTTITQQSRDLDIMSRHAMLNVTNDLTDSSEIGSLFLLPDYRRDRLGRLLSLARFLFIASFPEFFAEQIIAELRGTHDPSGNAPFYDSIARHFFEVEFARADYINATQGNQFISDLMPKYPIYVDLLPKAAQDAIGQPHPSSVPAKAMLERQGFRWQGYVDIFDGGPTLQADRSHITSIQQSALCNVTAVRPQVEGPKTLLTNTHFTDFRAILGRVETAGEGEIIISQRAAQSLQVQPGDTIRLLPAQNED